jgi:hypothetical protein
LTIARHYEEADRELSFGGLAPTPDRPDVMVVIVTSMNRVTVEAVRYAVKRCQDVRAVHVDLDSGCAADVRRRWHQCGGGAMLDVLESPYRSFVEPDPAVCAEGRG